MRPFRIVYTFFEAVLRHRNQPGISFISRYCLTTTTIHHSEQGTDYIKVKEVSSAYYLSFLPGYRKLSYSITSPDVPFQYCVQRSARSEV